MQKIIFLLSILLNGTSYSSLENIEKFDQIVEYALKDYQFLGINNPHINAQNVPGIVSSILIKDMSVKNQKTALTEINTVIKNPDTNAFSKFILMLSLLHDVSEDKADPTRHLPLMQILASDTPSLQINRAFLYFSLLIYSFKKKRNNRNFFIKSRNGKNVNYEIVQLLINKLDETHKEIIFVKELCNEFLEASKYYN